MYNYRIAIPSYKRAYGLLQKTIQTLQAAGFPKDIIDIFIVQEELEHYLLYLTANPHYKNLIVGVRGLASQRAFIQDYYPMHQNILFVDDDIEGFKVLPGLPTVPQIFNNMFELLDLHHLQMFGVYPCDNGLFLKKRVVKGSVYCVGACFGIKNNKEIQAEIDEKEDHYNTCFNIQKYGAILRLDALGLKTKYWKNQGGMQVERTPQSIQDASFRISNMFPDILTPPYQKRKGDNVVWDVKYQKAPKLFITLEGWADHQVQAVQSNNPLE
jgi:hypothetical protein